MRVPVPLSSCTGFWSRAVVQDVPARLREAVKPAVMHGCERPLLGVVCRIFAPQCCEAALSLSKLGLCIHLSLLSILHCSLRATIHYVLRTPDERGALPDWLYFIAPGGGLRPVVPGVAALQLPPWLPLLMSAQP